MRTLSALLFPLFLPVVSFSQTGASVVPWPVKGLPIHVGNLAYTLQFYGDKPGFHHGLDILEPAGTPVYAPVSGKISLGYYYRIKIPYTFQIAIVQKNGTVWQFHHLDPKTIPASLFDLAKKGGTVSDGALLGKIYDASQMGYGIFPHVHINVISSNGHYQEPLRFFPKLSADKPPVIRGLYLIDSKNRVLADDKNEIFPLSRTSKVSALIVDAFDVISPSTVETTPASISVWAFKGHGGKNILLAKRKFDYLPGKNFFMGVSSVYQIAPLSFSNGKILENEVDMGHPRRFLFRFPKITNFPVGSSGLKIVVSDFAGKETSKIWKFPALGHSHLHFRRIKPALPPNL